MMVAFGFIFVAFCVLVTWSADDSSVWGRQITYSYDPILLNVALKRAKSCGSYILETDDNKRVSGLEQELRYLSVTTPYHFSYSHELLAFQFFVEKRLENPFYVADVGRAEFEYIPLLPLHWRTLSSGSMDCSYNSFVQDLLEVISYLGRRGNSTQHAMATRFSVLGTYNLRTTWGGGMPLQTRRGAAWQRVSDFVTGLSIGHYERWPECPDLLRKQFKHLVELPFPAHNQVSMGSSQAPPADPRQQVPGATEGSAQAASRKRKYVFAFVGGMDLPGPEKACAVRTALYLAALLRDDVLFVNTTVLHDERAVFDGLKIEVRISQLLQESVFCLVTPGRSYATSFFFKAVHAGCVPVLINDWLVLPFPHVVPYPSFCLRVYQQDFLFNPHYVLNFLKTRILPDSLLLNSMRDHMVRYRVLLSYAPVRYLSAEYHALMASDFYATREGAGRSEGAAYNYSVVLPFELLLRELRYAGRPHAYYNNVPCTRYYLCEHRRYVRGNESATTDLLSFGTGREYYMYDNRRDLLHPHAVSSAFVTHHASYYRGHAQLLDSVSSLVPSLSKLGREEPEVPLERDLYHVPGISFRYLFSRHQVPNTSPYLCRHNKRLVGMYKMVFFMQCVRVLFPLSPGKFKPHDRVDMVNSTLFSYAEHAVDVGVGLPPHDGKGTAGPAASQGLSREEYDYVLAFHHIRRPPGYEDGIYPNPAYFESRRHLACTVYDVFSLVS